MIEKLSGGAMPGASPEHGQRCTGASGEGVHLCYD